MSSRLGGQGAEGVRRNASSGEIRGCEAYFGCGWQKLIRIPCKFLQGKHDAHCAKILLFF